jgi:sulfonate transport system permease protein
MFEATAICGKLDSSLDTRPNGWMTYLFYVALLLIIWQIAGHYGLIAGGVFPPPTAIAKQFWQDRSFYPYHLLSTLRNATLGFFLGNLIAVVLALLFTVLPPTEYLLRGFLVSLFSIPLIVLVPIIGIAFEIDTAIVILASVAVYYPTLIDMLVGLRSVDQSHLDVVAAYGGNRWTALWKVRLPSCLGSLTAGLRVAAPSAILGAMLGEMTGAKKGLGFYLGATIPQALPTRLWGICLVSAGVAGLVYAAFAALGVAVAKISPSAVRIGRDSYDLDESNKSLLRALLRRALKFLVMITATLVIWELCAMALNQPYIIKGPNNIFRYILSMSNEDRSALLGALAETLQVSIFGLAAGLAAALLFAIILSLRPHLATILLPFALVSQTVPLIALTSLIVLLSGRGIISTLAITVSVTFFPAFAIILQQLREAPKSLVDVIRVFRDSPVTILMKVRLPSALPHVFAAARLAAPRVLMGVILAEYLATNTGLGALLSAARGRTDFNMMWTLAATTALVSLSLYQIFQLIESILLKRYGFTTVVQ